MDVSLIADVITITLFIAGIIKVAFKLGVIVGRHSDDHKKR